MIADSITQSQALHPNMYKCGPHMRGGKANQHQVDWFMQLVRAYLDTAVANNLNVMRIWAQTVGFNRAPFQTSPGVYNQNIFRGLDYALDQARQRNIKAGYARP